jgi:hypothetical protein
MQVIAWNSNVDEAGVLSLVPAVTDPSIRTNGNDIVMPADVNQLFGALACVGSLGTRANLVSPSLRRTNPYDISPLILGLVPTTFNPSYFHPDSPLPLDYNENLNAQCQADPAAAERHTIVAWLTDKPITPVKGKMSKVRFSTTSTLAAGAWVNSTINFIDPIPAGNYKCIGAELNAPAAIVARFYPVGGKWRPGFPCKQTIAGQMAELFRNGNLGEWFTFDQVQPPTIDILSSAAAGSTTYFGVMDLVPV